MTTKDSPLSALTSQANRIANLLKRFERGEKIEGPFAAKLNAARDKDSIKIAIAMDDKIITLDIAWTTLHGTNETGLADYILDLMRETRRTRDPN